MSRVVLIIYFLLLYLLISNSKLSSLRKNKFFIVLASLGLIIDSGFRNMCIGPDTYQYYLRFEDTKEYTIQELFNATFHIGNYLYFKDPGYWLFSKLFQYFSSSYRIFLIFVAIFFFTSLGRFIFKYVLELKGILIAYLFYIGMFWYFFSTTGCRQTLAVSLVIFAFSYFVNNKIILYIILCLLASLLHQSAIVSLVVLFIPLIKSKTVVEVIVLILFPLIIIFRFSIFSFFVQASETEDVYGVYLQAEDSAASITVFLFYIIVFILCLIYKDKMGKTRELDYCIKLYMIAMCFLPSMLIAASAMRICLYFTFSMYVIVPQIVKVFNFSEKYVYSILLLIALSSFSIRETWDYKFFWEEGTVSAFNKTFVVKEVNPFWGDGNN